MLTKLQDENRKLKARVKDLEKKLARVGTEESMDINKDLNGDKVMRTMIALIRKAEKERYEASESSKRLKKEHAVVTQEIESYKKQLADLENAESKTNHALKSAIHQQKLARESEGYQLKRQLDDALRHSEETAECIAVYKTVTEERLRNLVSKYLNSMQGQDDLQAALESLTMHFQAIKLTSIETLGK